ncbi:MAG: hypothetical protein ACXWFC_08550 [Nitrososphaeraceae archaeon]
MKDKSYSCTEMNSKTYNMNNSMIYNIGNKLRKEEIYLAFATTNNMQMIAL